MVRLGGSIRSETSEVYDTEHLFTRRAETPDVGQRLIDRIRWWETVTARIGG